MKLLKMTDFVLQESKKRTSYLSLYKIINYAKFLEQPLTLGMFVPCDEDGNVLKIDTEHKENPNSWESSEIEQYKKAQEKVLFEGFVVKDFLYLDENRQFIGWEIYNPSIFINTGNGWVKPEFPDFHTIEDLMSFSNDIELTESAIKQIGL